MEKEIPRTTVIFGSLRGQMRGFPSIPEQTPIIKCLEDILQPFHFSSQDTQKLLKIKLKRSHIAEKIITLDRLWCWPQFRIRDVLLNCSRLLNRKPEAVIGNLKHMETLLGTECALSLASRDADILNRCPKAMEASMIEIGNFLTTMLGVNLPPFASTMSTMVYRSNPAAARKVVEELLEILPKWCVQKMFSNPRSQWFTTNLQKIRNAYENLVFEILLPLVGDDAEEMASIVLAKYPNVLTIGPEELRNRFNGFQQAFGASTADVICTRPHLLGMQSRKAGERWNVMIKWATANPTWLKQVKQSTPYIMSCAMSRSSTVVVRLEYLATFSLSLERSLWEIMFTSKDSFCKDYPDYEKWHAVVHGSGSLANEESCEYFERILLSQWKQYKTRKRPRRHFVPDIDLWIKLLMQYGMTEQESAQAVRKNAFCILEGGLDRESTAAILKYLTNIFGSKSDVGKYVIKHPWVLGSKGALKLEWLFKIGLSGSDVLTMIGRYPGLPRCQLGSEQSEDKLLFLEGELGRSRHDTILFPQFWAMSLSKRLRPRFEFMQNNSTASDKFSLKSIFFGSSEHFCRRIKCSSEEYAAFLSAKNLDKLNR